MQQPAKAKLVVEWARGPEEVIPLQFNPTELSFSKGVQIAEIPIPGLDAPLLQFVRGQNETLTLDLFFDTTDSGMGAKSTSVTTLTDRVYELTKIEPLTHAPPICRFVWNREFPGHRTSEHVGTNQRRPSFRCVVESVRHKYTLFSSKGVPLRATATVTLREYKTLDRQLFELGRNSPDKTQVKVLRGDESLSSIAGEHYLRPEEWRRVADVNGIEDPRRLAPGTFLVLPPIP